MFKPRLFLVFALLSFGPLSHADNQLLNWYQQGLKPYLAFQLGQFPRFKNRSVRVVAAKQQSVSEEINALEKYLRKRLLQDLAAVPGVQLYSAQATAVQQSCQASAELLLTIDAKLDSYDQQLSVSVGLIDNASPEGQRWVSGFTRTWIGRGLRSQRKAAEQFELDMEQQGSRSLPFAVGQEDLLAAYIARQVDCQLGISATEMYIDDSDLHDQPQAQAVIRSRLAANPLIKLVRHKEASDTVLSLKLIRLDNNQALYLLTAQLTSAQGEEFVAAHTEAYITFPEVEVVAIEPSEPVVADVPEIPIEEADEDLLADNIIRDVSVLLPVHKRLCNSPNPWRYGEKKLVNNQLLDNSTCFAVELSLDPGLQGIARVFVASEDDFGDRYRILPSSCSALSDVSSYQQAGTTMRLPSGNRSVQTLRVDSRTGSERVFVVAITDSRLARDFNRFLQKIPGLCDSEADQKNSRYVNLKIALQRFKRNNPDAMSWRSVVLNHS